jgi:hypothetical protein
VRICLSEPGEKIPLEEGKEFFHKVVDRERQIRYIISIKIVHNLILKNGNCVWTDFSSG